MTVKRRQFVALCLGLPLVALPRAAWHPALAAQVSPEGTVESLHETLLGIMKRGSGLGPTQRFDEILPKLDALFDYTRMCRAIVGSAWSSAGEEDRKALVEAFAAMSAATYASRFKSFSGEKFEIDGNRPGPRGLALVDTRIITSDGTPVPITYVLRTDSSRWRLVDVLLDRGISELAVRRSEYNAILKESGIQGLTRVLREKAEALLSGS